ncbi:TlpA disulfide reductase family protein [Chitinophaga sp. HK235]|uniref:TlpA family protein disulfide reductase n=1 Tax=Chitinophaga sp. HK235 TaxID=2952571 RepID=UPI001BAA1CA4|nr:TlpA disulfide reductase family protein [Chitinophaga sp. HK235]
MDDQLLSNRAYLGFITQSYLDFLMLQELKSLKAIDSTMSREERTAFKYHVIEKNYTGRIRSITLRTLLEGGLDRSKDVEVFKPLVDQYVAQYATAEDAKSMLDTYNRFTKTNVGRVPPFFTLKDVNGRDVTLKDFAGKVVYMDFWASWCSPCRYEMKEGSPKLHARFKDNKDVVFLYVSIDDRETLWKKAIAEDKIEGVHVLSTGGFRSQVGQAFNISGVPHYIIIGRDGKIFDNNAPRPSQDTTVQKLNEALSKAY